MKHIIIAIAVILASVLVTCSVRMDVTKTVIINDNNVKVKKNNIRDTTYIINSKGDTIYYKIK